MLIPAIIIVIPAIKLLQELSNMSNVWQSAYNMYLIKGNIITTVVNTNRPTLFSVTAVLQSLSYWETQDQQYSDKDICPYVFDYFVQVYLESKCPEYKGYVYFQFDRYCSTALLKWLHQFIRVHMVLL